MAYRPMEVRQAGLDQVLRSRTGPVGRHMEAVGREAVRAANVIANAELKRGQPPAGYHGGFYAEPQLVAGRGVRIRVGNRSRVSVWVEQGTVPHIIVPRRARVLVFQNEQGATIFARRVNHPGTRAYRVLDRAVRIAVRRGG